MKKGVANQMTYIIAILLLIIGIFIGIKLVSVIGERTSNTLKEQECKESVLSHVRMLELSKNLRTGEPTKETPIKCERINLTLKQNDETKLKYQLADKMKICWDNWQRGKEELFIQSGTYCQPCYLIDFKHKDITIKNFDKFLMTTYIKGTNYTYMQYFTSSTNNEGFAKEKIENNPDIQRLNSEFTTNTTQTILFYYDKDRDHIKAIVGEVESIVPGAIIGASVGAVIVGGVGATICSLFPGVGTIGCGVGGAKIGAWLGGAMGAMIGGLASDDYPLWLSYILIRDYNKEELQQLGCESAPGTQKDIYQKI